MSVEDYNPYTKEVALEQLENALRGYSDDDTKYDNGIIINNAYEVVRALGATDYEIKRIEFLVEPAEGRQRLLDIEAKGDFKYRVNSLEHGAELLKMYERLRNEFGLKDPYIRRT